MRRDGPCAPIGLGVGWGVSVRPALLLTWSAPGREPPSRLGRVRPCRRQIRWWRPWPADQAGRGASERQDMGEVRYLVRDVDEALPFYAALGFELVDRRGPPFAIVRRGDLTLWLSGPGTSAARTLPGGSQPVPDGTESCCRWTTWRRPSARCVRREPIHGAILSPVRAVSRW